MHGSRVNVDLLHVRKMELKKQIDFIRTKSSACCEINFHTPDERLSYTLMCDCNLKYRLQFV